MSLPNYLAKIKSAGMYRFTFDKSQIPPAAAETMRLVIGYSDKGPFNNPVYIDNRQDFLNLFGNINKRLERKGVFFHRMALQALASGPILALNLKPFDKKEGGDGTAEQVGFITFNPEDKIHNIDATSNDEFVRQMDVMDLFDRDRFWKVNADQLPDKVEFVLDKNEWGTSNKYINIAATDIKDTSCSVFIRKCNDVDVKEYDVEVAEWYRNLGEDIPDYLLGFETTKIKDYFAEIYVFRGEFTDALIGEGGTLSDYFSGGALSTEYTNIFDESADALEALASDPNSRFVGLYRGCLLPAFKNQNGLDVSLDLIFNSDKDNHKLIMKLDDKMIDELFYIDNNNVAHDELSHWSNTGWKDGINTALAPLYITGYTYGTITRASSASQIYDASLGMLKDPGIFKALTNHVDSEYHYIVDTYATIVDRDGKQVECGSKANIAVVAKEKDNCLAIINAPSMADLQKGLGTQYNAFSMKEFEKGGYKRYFSLPTEITGASHCAFYTPLVFAEGLVRTTVPSAALVSNLFMEKWSSRQPYNIVAGPNYGNVSYNGLVGPDYNYSREDLDVLEPMGINAIVYVPRKGTYINSNQTAKQAPVSALSKVHVRELVIYLQNEIESMMQNYQWELNTQALRDTIKTSADAILERIKNNGGVYAYLNVCDSTNNTPDVIDNEMVILDTSIEPARGAGKMVQRLTIHKTGGISSLVN